MTTERPDNNSEPSESPKPPQRTDKGQPADEGFRKQLSHILGAYDEEVFEHIMQLFDAWADTQAREARLDELQRLLHEDVCEVMCGWAKVCDIKGQECTRIRKRLAQLRTPEQEGIAS